MSDQTAVTGDRDELLAELKSQVEAYERGSAIAEYTPEGTVLRANAQFADLVGADPAAIVGREHRSFVSPEVAETAEYADLWAQLRFGSNLTGEFRLVWQGTGDLWIRSTWIPVRNKRGEVVKVIEYALDVTPGKRAAADAAGKIQAISRSQAVIEFDLDGHILDANDNFLELVGYRRSEVVGEHHRMFVTPEEAQSAEYEEFWRALGSGEFISGEFHRIGQGGREVWLQAVYNPILGIDGKPWKVVKFAVDRTAAKLADAEFEGKVAAMNRSQAVIQFDLDGNILDVNDNFLASVGYTRDEVVGQHHRMFVSAETATSVRYSQFWKSLREGEFISGEFHRYGKDGRDVWLQATYNPIFGLDGKPWKVVKFASDVTAAKIRNAEFEGKVAAMNRSQAVIQFDLDGNILDVNENFLDSVGYSRDEVVGKHHRMFVKPVTAESAEYAQFWARLRQGEFVSGEFHRYGKDGRDVWLQATYNPIFGADGRPWKVVKFASDVTEAKARNADFEGKVTAIKRSQAVIEFDLDGTVLEANDSFLDLMGYRLEEIRGQHHRIFVAADEVDGPEYREFWEKLGRGEFHSAEYRRIAKDGHEVWIRATYNPILDAEGKPVKVVKFANDVTAEKLRNAEFAGRVAAIDRSQAVIEFDLDGHILTANENFLKTMGYSLAEIVGKHHRMFCTHDYATSDEYLEFWTRLRSGEFRSGRFHRIGKDGQDVWIQSSYNPILDLNGRPVRVVKYAYDVTEQVQLEQRLNAQVEAMSSSA